MSKSKKRNRSVDSVSSSMHSLSTNGGPSEKLHCLQDSNRALFLEAFEKPTQIYRYLRNRHLYSPIFIYRTLSYMKHRMSRSHRRRKDFKVDSVLQRVEERQTEILDLSQDKRSQNMTIFLKSIHNNTTCDKSNTVIRIEVALLTTWHRTRKVPDGSITQQGIAKYEFPLCHTSVSNQKGITIRKESFATKPGLVKSYSLRIMASYHSATVNDLMSEDLSSDSEPRRKRNKIALETNGQQFFIELPVFDKNGNCFLNDGEYEVALQEERKPLNGGRSASKASSWQSYPKSNGSFHGFAESGPIICFNLLWSSNHINGINSSPKTSINSNQTIENGDIENSSLILNHSLLNGKASSSGGLSSTSSSPKSKASSCVSLSSASSTVSEFSQNTVLIIYQFLFNSNTVQQTRASNDFRCPWCALNCSNISCLLKHLRLCHSRFNFFHVIEQKGHRIDVSINESYDGSYSGNPQDLSHVTTGFAFSRNGPVRRPPVTCVLVCKARKFYQSFTEGLDPDEIETTVRPFVSGHNRLYFHTDTCLPITPQEMDEDSEAENDPEWLRIKTKLMIDEFTDVNEGEKEVMKLWNLHIMKYGYVGECQISVACNKFVDNNWEEIVKRNLYRNFLLHLCNLSDFGLLSASSFRLIVRRFHQHAREAVVKPEKLEKIVKEEGNKEEIVQISAETDEQQKQLQIKKESEAISV